MANARALIYCLCLYAGGAIGIVVLMAIAMLLTYDLGRKHELAHMVDQAQILAKEGAPQ